MHARDWKGGHWNVSLAGRDVVCSLSPLLPALFPCTLRPAPYILYPTLYTLNLYTAPPTPYPPPPTPFEPLPAAARTKEHASSLEQIEFRNSLNLALRVFAAIMRCRQLI